MDTETPAQRHTYAKGDRYYGKAALRYERKRKKQPWWHVEHAEMEQLLSGLPQGLSILDVPFGTGRFVPLYKARGFQIGGLDASAEMLEAARQALGDDTYSECDTQTGTAWDLPYADASFDLLVSTRFLRDIIHFGQAQRALAEFARVARTHLILQIGEAIEGGRRPDPDEVWHSTMSADMNAALLSDHGLDVVEKRLVKEDVAENSRIHHILCRKAK